MYDNTIRAKPGQDWQFNAVTRDVKRFTEKYYGPENTLGHVYFPDHKKVWKKTLSAVKMMPDSQLEDKHKVLHVADCRTLDQSKPCSYQTRKMVRESKLGKDLSPN